MRRRAATAAAGALAFLLLCSTPLLAKPTRMIARSTSRWNAAPASLHSTHGRGSRTRHALAHPAPHAGAHAALKTGRALQSARAAAHAAKPAAVPARGRKRERTLETQADIAARSAILAADSGKGRRASASRESGGDEARATSRAAEKPGSGESALLANIGGHLQPEPPGEHLKSIEEEAMRPLLLPTLRVGSLYDEHGRLIVPPPLYGSHEVLVHQNEMADNEGLSRVRDDADLDDLRREKQLVPLPESAALTVDYRLPENRRYSRPWTAAFLEVLSHDFYAAFHSPIQVDSAVRTIAVQQRLERTNGNAAPASGDDASPHLTGQAVDIAKGGLTRIQIAWMRTYLQPLIDDGKIDVEEEFRQACFHISVYKNFLPTAAASRFAVEAVRQMPAASLQGGSNP